MGLFGSHLEAVGATEILIWSGSDRSHLGLLDSQSDLEAVGAAQISLGLPNSRLEWLRSHLGLLSSQRTSRCSWSIFYNFTWAVFSLGAAQISLGHARGSHSEAIGVNRDSNLTSAA